MTGDPADIGGAPVNVFLAKVENILARGSGAGEVSASGMKDTLRFSSRTARVEDEKGMFAIHRNGGAFRIDVFRLAVPPHIAPFLDVDVEAGTARHDHSTYLRVVLQGEVHILLERDDLPSAISAIGRDYDLGSTIGEAILDAVAAETAKDNAVNRSDAGASEHGDDRFGDQRHIN